MVKFFNLMRRRRECVRVGGCGGVCELDSSLSHSELLAVAVEAGKCPHARSQHTAHPAPCSPDVTKNLFQIYFPRRVKEGEGRAEGNINKKRE